MSLVYKTLIFFSVLLLVNCASKEKKEHKPKQSEQKTSKDQMQYITFQNADGTFGYDILSAGKLLIHQPNIPALPGNAGFYNEDDAVKTANLVIQKINAGIMPPSVTEAEIQGIIGNSR
jgi:chitinase